MTRLISDQQAAQAEKFDLNIERVELLLQRAGREVEAGLLPAAQIAIARQGEVVFQHNYGAAQDNSLTCIFRPPRPSRQRRHGCYSKTATLRKMRWLRISCRSLVPTKKSKSP